MSEISKLKRDITIARLRVLPSSRRVAIGNYGSFTKDELIGEVERDSAVGKKIVQIQMAFLTSMKDGGIYVK